jgi:hypothetical protein
LLPQGRVKPRYQDFPPPSSDPAVVYQRILALLVGSHSVEVLRQGDGVVLRVWLDPHCDAAAGAECI